MIKKKIAILGSTGSIGKTLLNIIEKNKKNFEVVLLLHDISLIPTVFTAAYWNEAIIGAAIIFLDFFTHLSKLIAPLNPINFSFIFLGSASIAITSLIQSDARFCIWHHTFRTILHINPLSL